MGLLDFLGDVSAAPLRDVSTWSRPQDVPSGPGAYILLAAPGTAFIYPTGRSSVFYIGQAANLRRRLWHHRSYIREAHSARRLDLYYPRYEYAARYGARFTYLRTWQGLSPRALEEILLGRFAARFRSWPVANNAGSWNRIRSGLPNKRIQPAARTARRG